MLVRIRLLEWRWQWWQWWQWWQSRWSSAIATGGNLIMSRVEARVTRGTDELGGKACRRKAHSRALHERACAGVSDLRGFHVAHRVFVALCRCDAAHASPAGVIEVCCGPSVPSLSSLWSVTSAALRWCRGGGPDWALELAAATAPAACDQQADEPNARRGAESQTRLDTGRGRQTEHQHPSRPRDSSLPRSSRETSEPGLEASSNRFAFADLHSSQPRLASPTCCCTRPLASPAHPPSRPPHGWSWW